MCAKGGVGGVLVVDDDEGIRESLVDILSLEGYSVVTATNGAEAMDALRAGVTPCLILLDLKMPVMSGAEFYALQQLDPSWSQIPVVIISADGDLAAKAAALGCPKFIEKPMKVPKILTCVERYCEHVVSA